MLARYPVTKAGAQMAWDAAHSDMLACRGQYTAEALSAHVPVYMYLFNDRTAQTYFPKMPGFQPLAYHTADIPYVFTGYHGGPEGAPFTLTPAQSQSVRSDGGGLGEFRPYRQSQWQRMTRLGRAGKRATIAPAYLLQDDGWKTVQTNAQFAAAHNCAFWNNPSFSTNRNSTMRLFLSAALLAA